MAIPHTPELAGATARYVLSPEEEDSNNYDIRRPVIAWDKLGRPLVMCGDRLTVASEAEFERFRKYVSISPAVDVEEAVTDVFRDWLESKCWQIAYVDFERVIRDSTKEAITEFLTKSRSAANPEQSP